MKTKIALKAYDIVLPMVKLNWYSSWKIVNYYQNQFTLYKSFSSYFRDTRVDLISYTYIAENILELYKEHHEKTNTRINSPS